MNHSDVSGKERAGVIQSSRKYFGLAVLLFAIEVLIALFVHDSIIRPYVGDLLVVILLYCMVKSFLNISIWKAATSVLAFSFLIETLQYFHFVRMIGLQHSKLASIIMGNSFHWIDLVAYTLGIAVVLFLEIRTSVVN